MLVIRVELHSAITRQITEIARMHIINDGSGIGSMGHYDVKAFRGRTDRDLDKHNVNRSARVMNYPREKLHVWNLVARALERLGYGAW
jgi:hypothetical protein